MNYKWLFEVTNPRVSNGGHPDDYAALDIDILLDDALIWEGWAVLDDCNLSTSNIDLVLNDCYAGGPSFTIGLDLGDYVSGESFKLDYIMTAFADTGDPYPFDAENATLAAIGDPFDPQPTGFGPEFRRHRLPRYQHRLPCRSSASVWRHCCFRAAGNAGSKGSSLFALQPTAHHLRLVAIGGALRTIQP